MNIKILDSWLRDFLKTDATPQEIAKSMSLTSVSIERMEPYNSDFIYDIEVTTNRPDLMSVVGLAREAAAVLPQFGHKAEFVPPHIETPEPPKEEKPLNIINDEKLVGRICAVVMEVQVKQSPKEITERLETSDIRSLNNVIDVTNYIMRTIGHPAHVFDYDRIPNHTIRIRESQKGEQITTLDEKMYTLPGGDIVADDGEGNIIDLIGIMGLENSVVTDQTKRIVLFIDNNDPHRLRKTSMKLGIRTEAVQMNEKGIDPELAKDALLYGIQLYEKLADGKLLSNIIEIYPKPYHEKTVSVTLSKIQQIMGIPISLNEASSILTKLGFRVMMGDEKITAIIPSFRSGDIKIPEDLVEEIARIYGYHNLPSILPPLVSTDPLHYGDNPFYWETRIKSALKYWGFTEVYSYPMVSEEMYEGPTEDAVKLANPLGEEFVYMRRTLVPSLLKVMRDNRNYEYMKLFEIANVYEKVEHDLPQEIRMLAGLVKKEHANFFEVKGFIEQLAHDLGIKNLSFRAVDQPGLETDILIGKERIGNLEVLDENLINFEINFEKLISHASLHKSYSPISKYPPVIEDIAFVFNENIPTADIIAEIKKQSSLISNVSLLDRYENSRTFHILYQDPERNLTTEEVSGIRNLIISALEKEFHAKLK